MIVKLLLCPLEYALKATVMSQTSKVFVEPSLT